MSYSPEAQQVPRLSPQEVRQRLRSKAGKVHLVCAYDDEEKCRQLRLDGSISLAEFERSIDRVRKDDELVFYCA